jgi:hypothetical protein
MADKEGERWKGNNIKSAEHSEDKKTVWKKFRN